jgi:hypothetical protein
MNQLYSKVFPRRLIMTMTVQSSRRTTFRYLIYLSFFPSFLPSDLPSNFPSFLPYTPAPAQLCYYINRTPPLAYCFSKRYLLTVDEVFCSIYTVYSTRNGCLFYCFLPSYRSLLKWKTKHHKQLALCERRGENRPILACRFTV